MVLCSFEMQLFINNCFNVLFHPLLHWKRMTCRELWKVKTNQGIQCPPNLSPMHWTPLHRDTAAEKALSAPGSSLRLAPGLAPCSCFLWQGKKSPEHSHLLLQQSFPWAALPGCSPLLPHAISCQKLLICSASFTVFSLDDGITYASFTTFPDTKNSCVFRASLSAVQNNLNFLLKKLLHEVLEWNVHFFFFFFFLQKCLTEIQRHNQSQRNHFHQLSLLGFTQSQENIPSYQWPCMQTCNSPASSGTLRKGERDQFPATT